MAGKPRTSPVRRRSSGTCATRRRRISAGPGIARPAPPGKISSPRSRMRPDPGVRIPASTSSSSLCPLPATPATPRISPPRNVKLTPDSRSTPAASRRRRSSTSSSTGPGRAGSLAWSRRSRRPIISSPSSSAEVCAVTRCATISPARITETRSVIAMISRSLCVISSTVLPCARRAWSTRNRSSASCGVNTPVGSSRISTSAPRYSALRISTRCCAPTGRSPTSASGSTESPYSVASRPSSARARARPFASRAPPSAPSMTFSSTVKLSTSMKCWCTISMPSAMASALVAIRTSRPATNICPESAV